MWFVSLSATASGLCVAIRLHSTRCTRMYAHPDGAAGDHKNIYAKKQEARSRRQASFPARKAASFSFGSF